jgi:hypothetical protein
MPSIRSVTVNTPCSRFFKTALLMTVAIATQNYVLVFLSVYYPGEVFGYC